MPEGRSLPGDRVLYAVNDRFGREPVLHGLWFGRRPGWPGGGRQDAGRRPAAGGRWPALSGLVAPFAPQRLASLRSRGPRAGAGHHDAGGHDRPLRRGHGLRRPHRHRLRDQRWPLHRPALRRLRLGDGQAARRAAWAAANGVDLEPQPRLQRQHLRRAVALVRWARPTPSTRTRRCRRGHGPPLAGRVLGPPAGRAQRARARALPPAAALRALPELPLRPLRHQRGRARAPTGARCSSPPTTAATSTWPRWRSWPREIGRPVRFLGKQEIFDVPVVGIDRPGHRRHRRRPRQRVGPAAARRRGRPARPARSWSCCPRGPSRAAMPSSTRCCTARPGRPAWPPRPAPPSCPSASGAPSRCGPARRACRTSPAVPAAHRDGARRAGRCRSRSRDAKADTDTIMAAIAALLPPEARVRRQPTAEELARTEPPR